MDTRLTIERAELHRDDEHRVFDWDKAARIIKEKNIKNADAGLSGDLEYTCGPILYNGKPIPKEDTYTYLASNWAEPVLIVDEEEISCYKMQSETEWNSGTYWPNSALEILGEELSDEDEVGRHI